MGKANVDPAELRRFARDLTRFNSDLETLIGGLQSRMRELERTWADQEQKRFAQEFEQTVKTLALMQKGLILITGNMRRFWPRRPGTSRTISSSDRRPG
jgi:uncharacterized protein YukE